MSFHFWFLEEETFILNEAEYEMAMFLRRELEDMSHEPNPAFLDPFLKSHWGGTRDELMAELDRVLDEYKANWRNHTLQ